MGRKMNAGVGLSAAPPRLTRAEQPELLAAGDGAAEGAQMTAACPARDAEAACAQGSYLLAGGAEAYRTLDAGKAPAPGEAEGSLGSSAQKTVAGMFSKQARQTKQQQQAEGEARLSPLAMRRHAWSSMSAEARPPTCLTTYSCQPGLLACACRQQRSSVGSQGGAHAEHGPKDTQPAAAQRGAAPEAAGSGSPPPVRASRTSGAASPRGQRGIKSFFAAKA